MRIQLRVDDAAGSTGQARRAEIHHWTSRHRVRTIGSCLRSRCTPPASRWSRSPDDHLEHEVELDSDPEVMRYLGDGKARTRAAVEEQHRRRVATAALVPGLGFWAGFVAGGFVGW